jgi:hypothetical protein
VLGVKKTSLPPLPVREDVVQKEEELLSGLLSNADDPMGQSTPFPLEQCDFPTKIGKDIFDELEESWTVHHSYPGPRLENDAHYTSTALITVRDRVCEQRDILESWIFKAIAMHSDMQAWSEKGRGEQAYLMRKAANLKPTPTRFDLPRLLWLPDHELLSELNPFLSTAARAQLRTAINLWMQLCVLEDKMDRLCCTNLSEEALIQQLQVTRTWDPVKHPQWLAFEVEGRLQIRPAQYTVVKHMLENPSSIQQLNMGEGKTR